MKSLKEFLKAVMAGLSIGIGGSVYLNCDAQYVGKYVGAFFFCIGLITVVYFGFNLFTGKVGYVTGIRDIPRMLLYILGNTVGVALPGSLYNSNAVAVVNAKIALPLYIIFIKAIFCGILMYIAVDLFRKRNTVLGILFGVPAFILAGFEHSIADIYYCIAGRVFTLEALIMILVIIAGNAVGSILFALAVRVCEVKTED